MPMRRPVNAPGPLAYTTAPKSAAPMPAWANISPICGKISSDWRLPASMRHDRISPPARKASDSTLLPVSTASIGRWKSGCINTNQKRSETGADYSPKPPPAAGNRAFRLPAANLLERHRFRGGRPFFPIEYRQSFRQPEKTAAALSGCLRRPSGFSRHRPALFAPRGGGELLWGRL